MAEQTLSELFAPEVDSIESTEMASRAKRRMDTNETRSLLVVENDQLVGIVKRNDLLDLGDEGNEKPVKEFMSTNVPAVEQTQTVQTAFDSLGGDINVEQVPVVDESGKLIGVINRSELVSANTQASRAEAAETEAADRVPVENGMTVKDAGGAKLGNVVDVSFRADGNVEFLTIEHGLIFKKQKRFPGEVVDRVEDGDLLLGISSLEFGMVQNVGENE